MAFADALQDVVTISTVAVGFRAGSNIGEEVKTLTPLYTSVPCRLMSSERTEDSRKGQGSYESQKENWLILMEPAYNGANRGDRAVILSKTYLITKKHEIRGASSAINHVVYYLEEQN